MRMWFVPWRKAACVYGNDLKLSILWQGNPSVSPSVSVAINGDHCEGPGAFRHHIVWHRNLWYKYVITRYIYYGMYFVTLHLLLASKPSNIIPIFIHRAVNIYLAPWSYTTAPSMFFVAHTKSYTRRTPVWLIIFVDSVLSQYLYLRFLIFLNWGHIDILACPRRCYMAE